MNSTTCILIFSVPILVLFSSSISVLALFNKTLTLAGQMHMQHIFFSNMYMYCTCVTDPIATYMYRICPSISHTGVAL